MSPLELLAAAFGVASVYLGTRQSIWSWPTAVVNVGLYFVVFLEARLYAGMGLQGAYLILSLYGWYQWRHGGPGRPALRVSRAKPGLLLALLALNLVAWVALGSALRTGTDAVLPWLDSLLTTTSLIAQWMLTRKLAETWALWIAVDIVYVPMYLSQGMPATAGLYLAFLALALKGWRDWRRSLAATHLHSTGS